MSDAELIRLSEVIHEDELNQLLGYIRRHDQSSLHNNIIDWLGANPAVLARMNEHRLLLTYFSYLLEALITTVLPRHAHQG